MSELVISGLRASVAGKEILKGIDLRVASGEVHAVMGPNGSGKSTLSHVVMGRPGYEVLGGSVTLDGVELLDLPTWERARAGLFLGMQYPIEVPGVSLVDTMVEALERPVDEVRELVSIEAGLIGFDERFLLRSMNVDMSGGERKRNETLQLAVLKPRIAILDELDSGLDVDALRAVSRRVEVLTSEIGVGVLAITHYTRLLLELKPDVVHVMSAGRIVREGGPELADELESTGYAPYVVRDEPAPAAPAEDPFADPLA